MPVTWKIGLTDVLQKMAVMLKLKNLNYIVLNKDLMNCVALCHLQLASIICGLMLLNFKVKHLLFEHPINCLCGVSCSVVNCDKYGPDVGNDKLNLLAIYRCSVCVCVQWRNPCEGFSIHISSWKLLYKCG
jgi:hypothetical protein